MIERETIEDMFNQIRLMEDAPFDVDKECLWTYFLLDADRNLLEEVGEALEQEGFIYDGILDPVVSEDDPEGEPHYFYLQVSRVECHSVESLLALNEWFYEIADYYGLEGYDGMDVGAVDAVASGHCQ